MPITLLFIHTTLLTELTGEAKRWKNACIWKDSNIVFLQWPTFKTRKIALIHNGLIWYHDLLFQLLKKNKNLKSKKNLYTVERAAKQKWTKIKQTSTVFPEPIYARCPRPFRHVSAAPRRKHFPSLGAITGTLRGAHHCPLTITVRGEY